MTHHVVVAAGLHRTPHLPLWPGIDSYRGELIHARAYRGPSPYIGRDVLIVGCGPTGMDIATELAGSGAGRVRVSIRNSPLLFRLSPLTSLLSQATKHLPLPTTVIDRASLLLYRLHWGDLSALGFAAPREGLATALARSGHTAGTIDRGLVSAVRRGAIEIVAEVVALDHDQVRLGSGDAIRPDVVIAATGQRPNLTEQAGHLDVLAAAGGRPLTHGGRTLDHAPGLYFIGYRVPSGQLPDLAIDARAIARAIAGMGRITQWRRRLTSAAGSRGPGRAEVLSLSRNTSSPTPGGVCDVDPNR